VKLSCPSCGAKYSIADEKVQDRLAKIRCRKCSATIIVDGKVDPPNVYTSEGGSVSQSAPLETGDGGGGPAPGEYSVDFGDNDQRTMSADDIVQAYRRGQLTADTYVWTEGMADWQPVGSVPELAEALTTTAAAAPAAPAAAPRAARTGSGRGSATDLFGGIDKAGSEEDVMTSAPQPSAAASPALATGARNESSVLFSLSALTASGPLPTTSTRSTASATDTRGEDSGLIDLKALTSAAGSLPPPNPLALGAAPLGMAAPLGGMTAPALAADGPSHRGGGSKTGLYIAGALVFVGALIAGAIVMTAGNRDTASAANAATQPVAVPTPAAQPAQAAEPEAKKEEPTAQAPATGTAVAEAAPKDTPTKQASTTSKSSVSHSKPKSSNSTSSSNTTTAAVEKPAPVEKPAAASSDTGSTEKKKPAVKKEKTCNCGPGDLMCAMKCAAS
jgi:predicted Zn finger-like uncharacterized protein